MVAPETRPEIQKWLRSVLTDDELARWPLTEGGELSTSAASLKRLTRIPEHKPLVDLMNIAKLVSCFSDLPKFINPVTGRLHPSFKISGAKSGRFSCNHLNLQQFPKQKWKEFRKVVVAEPGYVLVSADWNQMELRCGAALSGDPELTRVYAEGLDLHRLTAADTLNCDSADVTEEQRNYAKQTNLGSIYGISAFGLKDDAFDNYGVERSIEECEASLAAFFTRYCVFDAWRHENLKRCNQQGLIQMGCGRVVLKEWDGIYLPYKRRETTPITISGTCMDATLRAITWTDRRVTEAGIPLGIVACIHELLVEVPEDDVEKTKAILVQTMTDPFTATCPGAPTLNLVDAKVGRSWFET
jgi:DNA polymerase-1